MAVEYEVTTLPTDSASTSRTAGEDITSVDWNVDFQVIYKDDADPDFDGSDITAINVLALPELPKVAQSVYYDATAEKIVPYLVCRQKTATRTPEKKAHWIVSTQWDSGDTNSPQGEQDVPVALTDISPRVTIQLGETERVRYEDYADNAITTPTGNMYPDPAIERIPTQIIQVKQYEPFISYDTMEARKFLVNEAEYRNKPAWSWLIQEVEATDAIVQLVSGPTLAALVTYTLESNPAPNGWKLDLAAIDTHYLEQPANINTKKAFVDQDYQTYINGLVDAVDGGQLPNQLGEPEYNQFELYRKSDFSFLQA